MEVAKESQDNKFFVEFTELSKLFLVMEEKKRKRDKLDLSFEITHEIAIGILMVLFASSQTRTTSGLEALFQIDGTVELWGFKLPIDNFGLFIGSTLLSMASFLSLFVASNAGHWSWKAKAAVALYGAMNLSLRLESIITFFTPSLGKVIIRKSRREKVRFG